MTVNAPILNGKYYQYSVRHEKGSSPFFPFAGTGRESVNSANGNLFFTIPLVSRTGRNGLGIEVKLAYNSKIWDFYYEGGTRYAALAERESWVGVGWTLLVARMIDNSANGRYYLTLSDGSNHELAFYDGAWRTMDSTYAVYEPSSRRLTLKGGTNITFGYQDPVRTWARYATRVQDVNGNYLEIGYQGDGGRISAIQDTLGNTYTFQLENNYLRWIRHFNTNDTTQPTSTIALSYQEQSIAFGSGATTDPSLGAQRRLRSLLPARGAECHPARSGVWHRVFDARPAVDREEVV